MLRLIQDEFAEPADDAARDEPLVVHQHPELTESENLAVFVHGLGGRRYGPRGTWGSFPAFIFADLPKVDVGLYSYVSLLGRLRFGRSVPLEDEAQVLAGILRQASAYRRIILIGHSMGGLICKAAVKHLIESGDFAQPPHVSGLILLATPQAGSLRVPRLARLLSTDGRALAAHGDLVTRLNSFFTTRLVLDGTAPPPGREALPTWAVLGSSDVWVDTLSASLGLPLNRITRVRGNHTAIVKPATRDADAFRVVADCVRRSTESGDGQPGRLAPAELPVRDTVSTAGVFLDRVELMARLLSFEADPQQRLFLLVGPPGWGKRHAAASLVQRCRDRFDDVVWIDCTEVRGTASQFLGQLDSVFREHGDTALEGRWRNIGEEGLPALLRQLVAALERKRYLMVLHRVDRWLAEDGTLREPLLRATLLRILTRVNAAKIVATGDMLPRLDPGGLEMAPGTSVAYQIGGLDDDAAVELLRVCGLRSLDDTLLRRACAQYGGMPAALRIFAELVTHAHRDPEQLLRSTEVEGAVDALLTQSLAALPEPARHALDLLAVLRLPLPTARLSRLDADVERHVPMLAQRFLLEVDRDADTVFVAEAVRRAVLGAQSAGTRARCHRAAADAYAISPRPVRPAAWPDGEAALEETHHRLASGDVQAAAHTLWWAGPAMLTWGYVDVVAREAAQVAAATAADTAGGARTSFLLGEVADLRSRYDEAQAKFAASRRAAAEAGLWSLVSLSLHRLGRIAASHGRFAEANEHFAACIECCERHDVTAGWAGSLLSLGWVARQRGASPEEVRRRYDEALTRAREAGDAQIEASANRELGYLAWITHGRRDECRRHFEAAREISERDNEIKELGAVHTTLGHLEVEWGDTHAAIRHSWEAVRISKSLGDSHMLASAYDHLGQAWERQGDLPGAEQWYQRSHDKEVQINNPSGQVVTRVHLSRVRRKLGRLDEAAADLDAARRLVAAHEIAELEARIGDEERALLAAGGAAAGEGDG